MVMALSVELGSMSPATCTWAPVDWQVQKKNVSNKRRFDMVRMQHKEFCCQKGARDAISKVFKRTSRISLILQPPFPIREPHWLAGTTMRRVTGGLLVAVLFVIELLMSWTRTWGGSGYSRLHRGQRWQCVRPMLQTSSSLSMIMENALKMAVVGPAKVMILSGQLPSEMLMRAPLCRHENEHQLKYGTWAKKMTIQEKKCCYRCFMMDVEP